MKSIDEQIEKFFILTNPIYWVVYLIAVLFDFFKWVFKKTSLENWYYYHFKIHKASDKTLRWLVKANISHQKESTLSRLNIRSWEKASKKAEIILKERNEG